ncbi:MAG: hypothetical protein J2P38_11120 [Candidatus Dormibacteraeota bacterium]|nr:hypothetical protein [Candidatus Dormibacteraeota bacterium]
MTWSFVRKEWGAISFVAAVIVGLIAVPVALLFHNPSNTGAPLNRPAAVASPTGSPSPSPSPTASPSPSPTATPTAGG